MVETLETIRVLNRGDNGFYFDTRTKLCQPFYYKGCNGNGNRFSSRAECVSTCANVTSSPSSSDGHGGSENRVLCPAGNVAANDRNGPLSCDRCPHGYECHNGICCGTREFTCSLGYDAGRFPSLAHTFPCISTTRTTRTACSSLIMAVREIPIPSLTTINAESSVP
ncbi:hypothetical protein PENTCL1PPCAC_18010, partial [Pristionchus entomophagus]